MKIITKWIKVLICLFIIINNGTSQTFWTNSIGPYGGPTYKLLQSRTGNIYVGTSGVYKSTDEGANWYKSLSVEMMRQVNSMSLDSNNNIYVCGVDYEFFKSTDDGNTWEDLKYLYLPGGANCITVTKNNVLLVYGDGLYRSKNGGINWKKINDLPIEKFDVSRDNIVYAITYDEILMSSDDGEHWLSLYSQPRFTAIKVLPNNTVLAGVAINGSGTYVLVSSDQGMNWLFANNGTPFDNIGNIRSFLSMNNGSVLTSFYRDYYDDTLGSVIKISRDNGNTWMDTPFTNYKWIDVNDLMLTKNNSIFAATDLGIYVSKDQGISWIESNNKLTNTCANQLLFHNNSLYCQNSGVFISSNKGFTWSQINIFSDYAITLISSDKNDNLYVCSYSNNHNTERGLYISRDGGISWEKINRGLENSYVLSLIIINNNKMFALCVDGLYYSEDTGQNWIKSNSRLSPGINTFGNMVSNSKGDLLISTDDGVFRSSTAGSTWEDITKNFTNKQFYDVQVNNKDEIFVTGFPGEISRSTDDGNTWSAIDTGIRGSYAHGINIYKNVLLCYATRYFSNQGGLYLSMDNGNSWTTITYNLDPTDIIYATFDDDGYMYACTRGGGIFKSNQKITSVINDLSKKEKSFSLDQNFPNPFGTSSLSNSNTTQLSFSINTVHPQYIIIKIFDGLGREIETLAEGIYYPGAHQLYFDAEGLNSGQYFIRMNAQNNGVVESKVIKVIYIK